MQRTSGVSDRGRSHRAKIAGLSAMLAACGAAENNATEDVQALHACELLPAAEVGRLAGDAVVDSRVGLESAYSGHSMSQCTHSFQGGRSSLTVQVRGSGAPIGVSRQTDADEARANDDGTGYGEQIADAIQSGTDVMGVGDFAYSYEVGGTIHLVAYWDQHYSVWLWTQYNPEERDEVLQIEKAAAQIVIDKL